jgi:ABC-type Fe3+ transport system permease subunit
MRHTAAFAHRTRPSVPTRLRVCAATLIQLFFFCLSLSLFADPFKPPFEKKFFLDVSPFFSFSFFLLSFLWTLFLALNSRTLSGPKTQNAGKRNEPRGF